MMSVSLTVVIPTYNSARFIDKTVMSISEKCAKLGLEEIIVVNDGSTDETTSRVKEIRNLPIGINLRLIEMRVNVGQTNAAAAGLSIARSDFILTLDDDVKDDLGSVIDLLTELKQKDLDFVVGAPNYRVNGLLRGIATELIRRVAVRLFKTPKKFRFSSFCIYSKEFITASQLNDQANLEIGWMFLITKKYINVRTGTQKGLRENSNFKLRALIVSSLPFLRYLIQRQMKLIGALSTLLTLTSALFTSVFVLRYLTTGAILPGFTSLYLLGLINLGFSGLIAQNLFRSKYKETVKLDIRRTARELK